MKVIHPVAFWTGFTAFCGNFAGLKVLNLVGAESETGAQILAAAFLSLAVGGVAYGRERIIESKREWKGPDRRQEQLTVHEYKEAKDSNELNTNG